MITTNWDNRFLGMFIVFIIFFVLVVSWIISHENDMTNKSSLSNAPSSSIPIGVQPTYISKQPINAQYAPAQSPESTKQMFVRMQQPVVVTQLASTNTTNSSDQNYNIGYEWANNYQIMSMEQCEELSAEYLNGCHAYIEVKRYVNSTDQNVSTINNLK